MAPVLWKGLLGLGLFGLAHAAFSAAQHRSYTRLTENEDEALPVDIILQTLLAFSVTCYSVVHLSGEFKDIDTTSKLKRTTCDSLRNRPEFYVFSHRGQILFPPLHAMQPETREALYFRTLLKLRKVESLGHGDF